MRRNISKLLFAFLMSIMMLATSTLLFACDEKTLDDIPWSRSSATGQAVLEQVGDATSKMVGGTQESLSTPVLFKTTITYNFQRTANNDFTNKEIVDDIELSLSSIKRDEEPMAKYTQIRTENGVVIYKREDIYSYEKSTSNLTCFTTEVTYYGAERLEESSYFMQTNYADGNDVFVDLLTQNVVLIGDEAQVNVVRQKVFEEVDYYQLSATTSTTKRAVNQLFSGNEDIFANPHLFEVKEEGYDYVDGFSCAYGINQDQSHYLSYYTLDYNVCRATQEIDGERETYLKVSVISKLDKKGEDVDLVVKPGNVADYEVATFVKTLQGESYITYREDTGEDSYTEITVYNNEYGRCVVVKRSSVDSSDYYYISNEDGVVYKLNPSARTYYAYTTPLNLDCLDFNFNLKQASAEAVDLNAFGARVTNRYYYYLDADGFVVSISDQNEVVGIATGPFEDARSYRVLSYFSGSPDIYYDTTGFTLVEAPEQP